MHRIYFIYGEEEKKKKKKKKPRIKFMNFSQINGFCFFFFLGGGFTLYIFLLYLGVFDKNLANWLFVVLS